MSRALRQSNVSDPQALKAKELSRSLIELLGAATGNAASGAFWLLKHLSDHPEYQNILHHEGAEHSKEFRALLAETFRLHPPQNIVFPRTLNADTELVPGVALKKGDIVTLSIANLGKNPHSYDAPEEFLPQRFSQQESPAIDLSFSSGERKCPAESFSVRSIYALAQALAVKGKIHMPENVGELYEYTLRPDRPAQLQIR